MIEPSPAYTSYLIYVMSTTEYRKWYTILIDIEKKTVTCDCKAGRIHGYCKHIKFYKRLIKSVLHDK